MPSAFNFAASPFDCLDADERDRVRRSVDIEYFREGAVILARDGGAWQASESQPVKVADTVGAGDSFLAGMLVALLDRPAMRAAKTAAELTLDASDVEDLLANAIACASLCVMETGCVPPTRDQVLQRLANGRPVFQPLA